MTRKDGRNKDKSMIYRIKDWVGMTIGHFTFLKMERTMRMKRTSKS